MDPTACWNRWMDAVIDGDMAEAFDAWTDLTTWLARGGFEPAWHPKQAAQFRAWRVRAS